MDGMWQTYTPDGMILTLRRNDDGWLATCLTRRVEAATAEEAIRGALGVEKPSGEAKLEEWIAEHVAALEAEAEGE
jgi:hypothetical protein